MDKFLNHRHVNHLLDSGTYRPYTRPPLLSVISFFILGPRYKTVLQFKDKDRDPKKHVTNFFLQLRCHKKVDEESLGQIYFG